MILDKFLKIRGNDLNMFIDIKKRNRKNYLK